MRDRTLQILTALVEDFIITATPVASKKLLENSNMKISSATVRNEFAILEEVGLIHSPHISAGKIPTEKGFRFFVDELLKDKKEEEIVASIFEKHIEKYKIQKSKESIFDILRLVAHLSGNVAFSVVDNDQTFYVGVSNVLRSPEYLCQPEKAAQIVEILEGREKFQNMLSSLKIEKNEVKIFIGEENLLEEISSCAMLLSGFQSEKICGKIGILGPMRMRYGFNKALLENALKMII